MPLVVNGETIDDALVRAEERALRPKLFDAMRGEDSRQVEARVKDWARENLVERILLRQCARGENPTLDDDAAVAKLLEKLTAHVARPRNKDVVDYYRKHRESLVMDEMVHAGHILKIVDEEHSDEQAREAIDEAKTQVAIGVLFESLADFADLGFLPRGTTVPEFESVAFALEPREVSPVFRTQFGYHIVKVYEKRPAGIPPLEMIRQQIEESLFQQKRQKVIEQHIDHLRAKADVISS